MKVNLILLFSGFILVQIVAGNDQFERILDYIDSKPLLPPLMRSGGGESIRVQLDRQLDENFPYLGPFIKASGLDQRQHGCYDQSIRRGSSTTVNIFNETAHSVMSKYFKEHDYILRDVSLAEGEEMIKSFFSNLERLAYVVLRCVKQAKRRPGEKPDLKLGLTPMVIWGAYYGLSNNYWSILKPKHHHHRSRRSIPETFDRCSPEPQAPLERKIPEEFNWAHHGYVSPVMFQGLCGSCYVLASVAAFESAYRIHVDPSARAIKFSDQAVLNCMSNGCRSGFMQEVMQHMVDVGVTLEINDPYVSGMERCTTNYTIFTKAQDYCFHVHLTEEQMQRLVLRNGPVGVAIDVKAPEFIFLRDSPWHEPCGTSVNHAVLLVGWSRDYWIIQNSWSDEWGIDGYLYLPRGGDKCGVRQQFAIPLAKNGPSWWNSRFNLGSQNWM